MSDTLTRILSSTKALAVAIVLGTLAIGSAEAQHAPIVHYLLFDVRTGGDDLRGGNDNAFIQVFTARGTGKDQLNKGHIRLRDHTTRSVRVWVPRNTTLRDIRGFRLFVHGFRGDWHGDNWNVDAMRVTAVTEDGVYVPVFIDRSMGMRFTRRNREFVRSCRFSMGRFLCT